MTTWIAGWTTDDQLGEEFITDNWNGAQTWIAGTMSLIADEACENGDYDRADTFDAHSEDFMSYRFGTDVPHYHVEQYTFFIKKRAE